MKKAIDAGHCQACGRIQKLPNGRLSLHGYKVYGYFSGICRGAGYLPYEQSTDQIARYVEEAKEGREKLISRQADVRCLSSSDLTWVNHWRGDWKNSGHVWVEVKVERIIHYAGEAGEYSSYAYQFDGKTHKIQASVHYDTLEQCCAYLNERFALSFDREISSLADYIKWQGKRISEWQLMPLLPLTVKQDDAGFDPCEAVHGVYAAAAYS